MRRTCCYSLAIAIAAACSPTMAALISRQVDNDPLATGFVDDGVIGVGEYSTMFANGGGGGFGGTLGSAGAAIHMDTDGTNLYIAFDPGADVNNNVVLYLDTRAGGFTDADMDDTSDPGRNNSSNLTRDVDDLMPILPDFTVVFGSFGTVVFELTAAPAPLSFMIFEGDQTTNDPNIVREIAIPLASLGNPGRVDFFANLISDTNFNSNESLPFGSINALNNPGFDNGDNGGGSVTYDNFNRFVVPEPGTVAIALLGIAVVAIGCRRKY